MRTEHLVTRRLIALAALVVLATATPTATAAAADGLPYKIISNVAYASAVGKAHLLDVYVPKTGKGPFPVILFQSGSAFMSDDTKTNPGNPGGLGGATTAALLATMWAKKGYVVVGYNVRSSSEAAFPAQVYDVKAAMRYVRAHAATFKIDPKHVGIAGTSSGAWAGNMAGTTGGVTSLEGTLGNPKQSSRVQAVADLFGPTDFLTLGPAHDGATSPESLLLGCALSACPATAKAASPVTYVSKDDPPFFISHATSDPMIPYTQASELFDALSKQCDAAQLALVPGYGHTDTYLTSPSLSPGRKVSVTKNCKTTTGTSPAPTYASLLAFFNRSLK